MIHLKRKQHGLSLIELMIAIGLSMVLTLGIIQIFISSKQTSQVQNALGRLQDNARFALDLLAHDIRMAGQLGCDSSITPANNTSLTPFNNGIMGYETPPALSIELIVDHAGNPSNADIIAGTDAIVVISAATNTIPVSQTASIITAANNGAFGGIETGEPLLISDCKTADIFIANKAVDDTTLNTNFNNNYASFSQLTALNYKAYYIREDNNNRRNLYRSIVNHNGGGAAAGIDTEPLLEGVENMQILYGEDMNGDGSAIRYVDADNVGNMNNVTSVRIHLLLATLEDNLASEPQSYWFAGQLIVPAGNSEDRRLFRSFTTTIKLRNQGMNI